MLQNTQPKVINVKQKQSFYEKIRPKPNKIATQAIEKKDS